jgi:hypothetical protein
VSECEHRYEHLDTSRWHDSGGAVYQIQWVRTDRFFCTRCLDIREVRKEEWSREKPDWYK